MVKPVYHPGKTRAKIDAIDLLKTFQHFVELGHADAYLASMSKTKSQIVVSPEFINHTKDFIVNNDLHNTRDELKNTVISVDTNC